MPTLNLCRALGIAAAMVGAALLAARASEWWGGLVPCPLCLLGRWPYRVALGFGLLGLVVPDRLKMLCAGGMVAALLGSAAIAGVHVGVEARWWPSPLPECTARFVPGTGVAGLPERPSKPCDEPAYLVPGLPVSMAAMSLLFSLAAAGGVALAMARLRNGRV
jgi:disulfide bond formation protein DsbB